MTRPLQQLAGISMYFAHYVSEHKRGEGALYIRAFLVHSHHLISSLKNANDRFCEPTGSVLMQRTAQLPTLLHALDTKSKS